MSHACSGSAGASPSVVRSEELWLRPKGSDPKDSDEGEELDLDDEPRALLIILNTR